MSIRLDELRRQRALVQEHLAWLDREIAAADAEKPAAPATAAALTKPSAAILDARISAASAVPAAPATRSGDAVTATHTDADLAAERILQEYRVAPDSVRQDVRKGCFLYFAAAFALFALGVVALYFALRSR